MFIGPKGLGTWRERALETFIQRINEDSYPVIPVLLPWGGEVPADQPFLREYSRARFEAALDEPVALDALERGITGRHHRRGWPSTRQ